MIEILYTNTDKIRAALGLSDVEVADQFFVDLDVEEQLLLELFDVYPAHTTLKASIDASTASTAEQRVWKILLQYIRYQAAVYLLPQLQLIVDKRRADGDFEGDRFGPDLSDLSVRIAGEMGKYRALLNPDYLFVLNPLVNVTPTYDPVTNEGV